MNQTYFVGTLHEAILHPVFLTKFGIQTHSNESGNFFSESIVMNVRSLVIFVDLHSAAHIL
jgi:hypothetical protein